MKAIVYSEYGPPEGLQLQEVAKPVPGEEEVLVKVRAVTLNRSDWESLVGTPFYARFGGLFRPSRHILGSDIAGTVEAVGAKVTKFKPGDAVFGDILTRMGGFAEYVCAREHEVALKPDTMSFEEASTIPQSGVIAVQGIRDTVKLQPGDQVLINGAGGGTGAFAIQLAKQAGVEVTAVDSGDKFDFMRSLGADSVIDYTQEDFASSGKQYDYILDFIATRSAFGLPKALKPNGSYFMVGGKTRILLQIFVLGPLIGRNEGKHVRVLMVKPNTRDMLYATDLHAQGKLAVTIDKVFTLHEVPDALRMLGAGKANGKIVVRVGE